MSVYRASVLLSPSWLAASCADSEFEAPGSAGGAVAADLDSETPIFSAEAQGALQGGGGPGEELEDDLLIQALESQAAVPALPGVTGLDLRDAVEPFGRMSFVPQAARDLASERVDPEWAREMEDQIRREIPNASNAPMNRIEVVCRTTLCGVAIEIPEGVDRMIRHDVADHLEATLGLDVIYRVGKGRSDQPDFVAVYLRAERDLL